MSLEETIKDKFKNYSTRQLVEKMEKAPDFGYDDEAFELKRRLDKTGQRYRWNEHNKIELYYPEKKLPKQKLCNVGLFDMDSRNQLDLL